MDFENIDLETSNDGGKAPSGKVTQVSNTMSGLKALWIGVYTTLLNVITLTLFRFWGRSQFRRHLWATTKVGDDALEYTGTGMELFIGFLMAIVTVMVPMLVVLLGLNFMFGEIAFAIGYFVFYLFMFLLIGLALFLARRYHLSRTRLRGIRFSQAGSPWTYATKFFLYFWLTAITLGWFAPVMRMRLAKYMWNNAKFGNESFALEDTPAALKEPMWKSFAIAWFAGVFGYAIIGFGVVGAGIATGADIENDPEAMLAFMGALYGGLFIFAIVMVFFASWHEAVMIRKIIKGLKVAGTDLSSSISMGQIIWLAITNAILIIITLGFGLMVAQMRVWQRIANSMTIHGEIDFDSIKQSADEGPSQGEGIADGLDIISNF